MQFLPVTPTRIGRRNWGRRLTHPIYNTDREIEAIGPSWREVHRFKEAAVMVPA